MSRENLEEKVKDAVKIAKVNKIIEAAVMIVFGLVLLIWSGTAIYVICKVASAIFAIGGIVAIIAYMFGSSRHYGSSIGLFGGVVAAVLGMYLFVNPEILVTLGPTIIGLVIIVTGIVELMEALRIEKQQSGGTVVALVIAVIELIVGVVFILHPDVMNNILFKLMGICLILDGIAELWVMMQIGKPKKEVPVEDIAAAKSGDFVEGTTRPLNEDKQKAGTEDNSSQSFVERAKARAAAKKKAKEAQDAAAQAQQAQNAQQTSQQAQGESQGQVDGYTTIPHHDEGNNTSSSNGQAK